jgi:inner membrane protein
MDSLSQFALGAAVSVAAAGRRAPVWKAALWGGVCGTLPDLDALIDHGDPISNMTLHRAQSHRSLYLTALFAVACLVGGEAGATAVGPAGRNADFRWWWLATFLALFTHPLLDLMTVYGTQLLQPFTDHPYAVGSVFIIDPLFHAAAARRACWAQAVARRHERHRWNGIGLAWPCVPRLEHGARRRG